ncbi:MAG: SPOR domain-containing protein [Treponema sp.]|jgi:cell division protein FtsN|nr:SPOR domain-containing protein [Treponema sp.]
MEKRKLLLVAVSVGVFLVIVLSAAILIFTPSGGASMLPARAAFPEAAAQPAVSSSQARGPASADAADMIRNPGEIQGLIVPPSGVPSLSVESPGAVSPASTASSQGGSAVQENNFYISSETPADADTSNVVISVPTPSAPGVPAPAGRTTPGTTASPARPVQQRASGTPASAAKPAAPTTTTPTTTTPATTTPATTTPAAPTTTAPAARTSTAPAAATSTAARPAVTSAASKSTAAKPAAPTAASPAARSTTVSTVRVENTPPQDYWIQTGAFSALVRAEGAKENLASKGLSSVIDNREVDGRIWYRVRIGPYTSENEANYWLTLVQAIDGFAGSQVRSTQR